MAKQGYQNIINVHNEESESQSTPESSFTNPLSNIGINLNEEQFQYSSYYNTYMNKRRSRNSSIIMAIIGVFIFFGFINFLETPHGQTSKAKQSESEAKETLVSPTSEKTASDLENVPTNPPISAQNSLEVSKKAFDRFRQETARTDINKVKAGCEATILIVPPCEQELLYTNKYFNGHCNYVGFERAQYLSTLFGDIVLTTDRRRRSLQAETNADDQNNKGGNDASDSSIAVPKDMSAHDFAETAEVAEEAAVVESAYILNTYLPIKWPTPSFIYALSPFQRSTNDKIQNYRELETLSPLAKKYSLEINNNYVEKEADMEKLSSELFEKLNSGEMCGNTAIIAWSQEFIPQLAQKLGCGPLQGCPLTYDAMEHDDVWSLKYAYEPKILNLIKGEDYKNGNMPSSEEKDIMSFKGWEMYGSSVKQNFDPLRFSAEVGDYGPGILTGGRWNIAEKEL